jgi:hypothetical protein
VQATARTRVRSQFERHLSAVGGSFQCQIECQIRGFEGLSGDRCAIFISKLLILLGLAAGSSPSLTTSKIKYLALRSRSHNRQCGTFAGPQIAHFLRSLDQRLDFRCRVVRGDMTGLVA